MSSLLDKLIIFSFCLIFYIQNTTDLYAAVAVIIALTCSASNSLFKNDNGKLIIFALYIGAGIYFPHLLFFAPLLAYDILLLKWQWIILLAGVPLIINFVRLNLINIFLIILFIVLAGLMKYRATHLEKIRHEYIQLRDSASEFSMQMESKNHELMERQDYEINLATLSERNRIAREIHDNVGHLLSSSILQIGALMATCRDETIKENLNNLKLTLSEGMNSIRDSIHDLHDESLDLYTEIRTLINNFSFCEIAFEYDIEGNPDRKIKYAFIAIVKEALSNVIKHSNATHVHIIMREHPALYQLIVKDNGTPKALRADNGIGLKNITDRVNNLGGNINISNEKGFTLFISIPRGGVI